MQKYPMALAVAAFSSLGAVIMPSGRAGDLPKIETRQQHMAYLPMDETNEPTERVRAANFRYYWFSVFEGLAQFFWDDEEVSKDEYRRNARPEDVTYLDEALARKDE
jgi:hypothetical protein